MNTFVPSALQPAHAEILRVVEVEMNQTVQAYLDNGNDGTPADFAADIVRVLTRHYLGGES